MLAVNLLAATFGGAVWCFPGLRITMSMLDLSTGHPVTAVAKFFTTMLTAINVGIGVVAGISLGKFTGYPNPDLLNSENFNDMSVAMHTRAHTREHERPCTVKRGARSA